MQTDKDPCDENVWNFRQSKLIGLPRDNNIVVVGASEMTACSLINHDIL